MTFGDFDYESIMLYGKSAFSKDGTSETMVPTNDEVKLLDVNSKKGLSDEDVKRVKELYKCGA